MTDKARNKALMTDEELSERTAGINEAIDILVGEECIAMVLLFDPVTEKYVNVLQGYVREGSVLAPNAMKLMIEDEESCSYPITVKTDSFDE